MTIPNGLSDTATFGSSNTTGLSLSANTGVNGIVFNAGASVFTITASPTFTLTISGVGITNNSGIRQKFVTASAGAGNLGQISFTGSATAGSQTLFTNTRSAAYYQSASTQFFNTSTAGKGTFINDGATLFHDASTAGHGTFITNSGGAMRFDDSATADNGTFIYNSGIPGSGGLIFFEGQSSAGNGTFTANGGKVSNALGAQIDFEEDSTASNATFFINGSAFSDPNAAAILGFGGGTSPEQISTAGNATLIANGVSGGVGGVIVFFGNCTGGTARVEVFGNGELEVAPHDFPGMTIGSIEGDGIVTLGRNNLTVGSNDLKTTFSGSILDGFPAGGSLTKIGAGKLTLSGANLYSGGTTIKRGRLLVNNTSGSGTGTGPVFVNAGALGGVGTIAGAVTVGNGSGSRAFLVPGATATVPSRLTIQSGLTFNSDATYKIQINSAAVTTDKVLANTVTINPGAQFTLEDLGNGTLSPGTVFTIINNTSASPIAGRFSNLPDDLTLTKNANTYRVNYQGGDGNDLTLTVQ